MERAGLVCPRQLSASPLGHLGKASEEGAGPLVVDHIVLQQKA